MKKVISILFVLMVAQMSLFAADLANVVIYWTENGTDKQLTINSGYTRDIQRDQGTNINIRISKSSSAPSSCDFVVGCYYSGGTTERSSSSNSSEYFSNVGNALTEKIVCLVNTNTGAVTINVSNIATGTPDLSLINLEVDGKYNPSGIQFTVGQNIDVECDIFNGGEADATTHKTGFYIGKTSNDYDGWFADNSTASNPLPLNSIEHEKEDYTFTNEDVGTRYINFFADYEDDIDEGTGEGNNKKSWGPFTVNPKPVELSIELTSPSSNVSVNQGDNVTISWTGAPDGASVTLRRDNDNVWNDGSGQTSISGSQIMPGSYTWNTTNVPPGTYYLVGFVTDGTNSAYDYAAGTIEILPLRSIELSFFRVSDTSGELNTSNPGEAKNTFNPGETARITLKATNTGTTVPVECVLNIYDDITQAPIYDSHALGIVNNTDSPLEKDETDYYTFDWEIPEGISGSLSIGAAIRNGDNFDEVLDETADGANTTGFLSGWILDNKFDVLINEGVQLEVPYYNQADANWCWAASASMVIGYYGFPYKPWMMASDLNKSKGDNASLQLITYLNNSSLNKGQVLPWKMDVFYDNINLVEKLKEILNLNHPILIGKNDEILSGARGHMVVVIGYDDFGFYINDPNGYLFSSESSNVNVYVDFNTFINKVDQYLFSPFGDVTMIYNETFNQYPRTLSFDLLPLDDDDIDKSGLYFTNTFQTETQRYLLLNWNGESNSLGYYYSSVRNNEIDNGDNWYSSSELDFKYSASKADLLHVSPNVNSISYEMEKCKMRIELIDEQAEIVFNTISEEVTYNRNTSFKYDNNFGFDGIELCNYNAGKYTLRCSLYDENERFIDYTDHEFYIENSEFAAFELTNVPEEEKEIVGSDLVVPISLINKGSQTDRFTIKCTFGSKVIENEISLNSNEAGDLEILIALDDLVEGSNIVNIKISSTNDIVKNQNISFNINIIDNSFPTPIYNSIESVWNNVNSFLNIDYWDNTGLSTVQYQINSNDDSNPANWHNITSNGITGFTEFLGTSFTEDWKISNTDWDALGINVINNGWQYIYFKITDTEGNVYITPNQNEAFCFGKDVHAPTCTINVPEEGQVLNEQNVDINWYAGDLVVGLELSGINGVFYALDQNTNFTLAEPSQHLVNYENLDEGIHNFYMYATDNAGNTSQMVSRTFEINTSINPPTKFSLLSPGNNATLTSQTPTFNWETSTDPDGTEVSYDLYYSYSPDFDNAEVITGINGTSYQITNPLDDNEKVYWKVKAIDESSSVRWSNEVDWRFTVQTTNYYEVTFKNWNGVLLFAETVAQGSAATAPANPTRDGYTFTGWDIDFSYVTSNLTVTAQYQSNVYTLTDDDVVVIDGVIVSCSYDFAIKNIIILEVLDGQTVVGIGDDYGGDFFYRKNITSVQLPSTLKTIGAMAFGMNKFTDVQLPSTLQSIGMEAFYNTPLAIVTIPNSVTYIGESAFYGSSLTNVIFEDNSNIESIGYGAFTGNSGLASIRLPGHANTGFIDYKDGNGNSYAPSETISDFETNYYASIHYIYTLTDDDVVVTNGVLESCSYDFAIKDIIITEMLDGQTVIGIGDDYQNLFYNKDITSIQLPSKLQTIGSAAFYKNRLTNVNIPNSVTFIGSTAFNQNQLTGLIIPNSVTSIGRSAFGSNQLTSIIIPNSVTSIGSNAFLYNRLTSVTISGSVILIEEGAFNSNQIVEYNGALSNGIIYARNPVGSEDNTTIVSYGGDADIIDFIPGSVISIGKMAFSYNNLTSITIPNTVKIIEDYAFYYRNNLTNVTFETNSNIERIGKGAFTGSSGLTSITLPTHGSPNFIEYKDANEASYNPGDNITDFAKAYWAVIPYTVTFNDWDGTELLKTNVESGSAATAPADPTRDEYTFTGWDTDFSNVTSDLTVTAQYQSKYYTLTDDDVVVVNGVIESCRYDFAKKDIIIPVTLDGQTVIGIGDDYNSLFQSKQITSVQLPGTLQTVGKNAFDSNSLTSITIPNSVITIGNFSFLSNNLTEITIPNSVISIGKQAFAYNGLTSVSIPNSVASIGLAAFNGNQITDYNGAASKGIIYERNADGSENYATIASYGGVADIIDFIPNSVNNIANLAFGHNGLTAVTIPNSVVNIGISAFFGNNLAEVIFESNSNIAYIENSAFSYNPSLASIILPTNVSSGFVEYEDSNSKIYIPGDNIKDFDLEYKAVFNYTLTDEDVVVINGIIESCSYDFAIKDIIIPDYLDGQTVIGIGDDYDNLFYNKGITSVQLPSTLEYIGERAFNYNYLTTVTIPSSVISIEFWAFLHNKLNSIIIPNSVTSIGFAAFNENQITNVNGMSSDGIIYARNSDGTKDYTSIVSYGGVTKDIDFIPNSATSIGRLAFRGNSLTAITIPSSVTSIGEYAFDANKLTSVTFESNSNIETIGENAFDDNLGLSQITLPTHANPDFVEFKDANGASYNPGDDITDFATSYEAVINLAPLMEQDSLALVALYNATDGPNWTNNENWLTGPVSTWFGITVENERVKHIRLGRVNGAITINGNNLNGELPTEIVNLTELLTLDLAYNNIYGEFPSSIFNLKKLKTLKFRNSNFTGDYPIQLSELTELEELNLWLTGLSGPIPSTIWSLTNLKQLSIAGDISGTISTEIGNLTELTSLYLYGQLEGELPAEIGNLVNLYEVYIGGNNITGEIPHSIGNLVNLQILQLRNNELGGAIPAEIGQIAGLKNFSVAGNNLSGVIPVSICDIPTLQYVDFPSNNFDSQSCPTVKCLIENGVMFENSTQTQQSGYSLVNDCSASIAYYAVTFIDWDGTELKVDSAVEGSSAIAPTDPFREGYTFNDWDIAFDNITSDLTVTAQYDINTYTVTFNNWDGTELKVEIVEYGYDATVPADPTRPGYTFTGWDITFDNITSDLTITAQYQSYVYTLTDNDVVVVDGVIESCSYDFAIKNIIIPDMLDGQIVTDIMGYWEYTDGVFFDKGITSVQLPSSLETIGSNAFYHNNLETLVIPISVVAIGNETFAHNNLNRITIPSSVTTILGYTFAYNNLYYVDFESNSNIGFIGPKAFAYNSTLTFIILPTQANPFFISYKDENGSTYYPGNSITDFIISYKAVKAQVCSVSDSLALVALYNNTEGANWNLIWDLNVPVGTWNGITMTGNRVTEVILNNNNLAGTLPDEMADLSELKTLHLWDNNLSGTLQSLTNLTNLDYIVCDNNQFSGDLTPFSNKSNMYWISFENNQLSGDITPLFELKKLQGILLNGNQFTGSIPNNLNGLDSLQYLWLHENQFSGNIPPEIGQLSSLSHLNLYSNKLTGSIPSEIGNLQNLTKFYAYNNNLSGEIPATIGNLTNLVYLGLYQNSLSGNIPSEIGDLSSLYYLGLFENDLSGELPPSIGNLSNLGLLSLRNNQFSGEIPSEIESLPNLIALMIANNQYQHINIEPIINWSNYSNLSNFVYSPQDTIGIRKTLQATEGEDVTIAIDNYTSSNNDIYQWYKDGNEISGANTLNYSISSYTASDAGIYYCIITNSITTDLNLVSNNIIVSTSTLPTYIVTFVDWDGTMLKVDPVEQGGLATAPADPSRSGYTFTGWDITFDNITSNLTVTAQYAINTYTVIFNDWDGTDLTTEIVEHGDVATAPADPTRSGYIFTGWDVTFDNITSDLTVTAQYEINTYTVTFNDWDGTELTTEIVEHGDDATAPADPSRSGYTFSGWDINFSFIIEDLIITAQYNKNNAPVAVLGAGITKNEGQLVLLNGSDSYDPENDKITFTWDVPEGINATGITDSLLWVKLPLVSHDTSYVIRLTVNDGEFDSETADVNILVKNLYPLAKFVAHVDGNIINSANINYRMFREDNGIFSEENFNFKISGDTIIYTVKPGNWIISGNPLVDSENFISTYVGDRTDWNDAEQLLINDGEVIFRELNCFVSESFEGSFSISGYVYLNESSSENSIVKSNVESDKQPLSNVLIYLFRVGNEEPFKAVYTNDNGYYLFSDLMEEDYFVQVSIPGFSQSEKILISLNNEVPEEVVSFTVNSSSGIITDVLKRSLLMDAMLYPNPSSGIVIINISSQEGNDVKVDVININGTSVFQRHYQQAEKIMFDISEMVSGMYFVKIRSGNNEIVKKLILDRK